MVMRLYETRCYVYSIIRLYVVRRLCVPTIINDCTSAIEDKPVLCPDHYEIRCNVYSIIRLCAVGRLYATRY